MIKTIITFALGIIAGGVLTYLYGQAIKTTITNEFEQIKATLTADEADLIKNIRNGVTKLLK